MSRIYVLVAPIEKDDDGSELDEAALTSAVRARYPGSEVMIECESEWGSILQGELSGVLALEPERIVLIKHAYVDEDGSLRGWEEGDDGEVEITDDDEDDDDDDEEEDT